MRLFIAGLVAILSTLPARAEIVTYEFESSIGWLQEMTNINGSVIAEPTSSSFAGGLISIGDKVKGRFSFDTATPRTPSPSSLDPLAFYNYHSESKLPVPPSYASFGSQGPTLTSVAVTPSIVVADYADYDSFSVWSKLAGFDGGIYIYLQGDGQMLTSAALSAQIDTNHLGQSYASFYVTREVNGPALGAGGFLTSLTRISPVPEPASGAMLLGGLAVIGAIARRRKDA